MNLRVIAHIVVLVFLKITLKGSGQIHPPDFLPRLGDRLHHIAVYHEFRIPSGWNMADGKVIPVGDFGSLTGDNCGVIRLFIPGVVGVDAQCLCICLFWYGGIIS